MFYRKLGKSNIAASAIIFGCWQAVAKRSNDVEIVAANAAALESGITTFDTAEGYGDGVSEQLLGKSLGHRRD